jgi:hypothetical protein
VNLPKKKRTTGLYGPVQEDLNFIIDYLRSITIGKCRGVRAVQGVNGTTLSIDQAATKPKQIRQFRVNSIENDFYTCHEWDGTTAGAEEVYIARPFEHRVSNFSGQTIAYSSDGDSFSATYAYTSSTKRTKTIAGVAETQVLIPLFKTDFTIIYASEVDFQLTAGPEFTPLTDPNDEPITLLDLNVDGRAWAKV